MVQGKGDACGKPLLSFFLECPPVGTLARRGGPHPIKAASCHRMRVAATVSGWTVVPGPPLSVTATATVWPPAGPMLHHAGA